MHTSLLDDDLVPDANKYAKSEGKDLLPKGRTWRNESDFELIDKKTGKRSPFEAQHSTEVDYVYTNMGQSCS